MPIYEYVCESCGHVFDVLQKMDSDPLLDCPECGKPKLKKLLSAPNFRLKGGGWYETDFKKDNQRNLAGDAAGASGASKEGKQAKKDEKATKTAVAGPSTTKKSDGTAASKPGPSSAKAD